MKKHYTLLVHRLLLLAAFISCHALAQQAPDSADIKKLLDKAGAWQKAFFPEKVYLNFDKPYYASGDTVWMKAYILMDNKASAYSSKLYVELLNSYGKMLQRLTLPTASGLATGYFPLDPKTIPEDSYTIRAYTNWQQNFGPETFYYHQFSVGNLGGKTWLVTEQNRNDNLTDTNHVQLAMRFTNAKGLPLVTRKLAVRVLENNKAILKSEITTGVDGTLTGAFTLPAKSNHRALSIAVEDMSDKDQHITFPFYPSGSSGDIDLQFMPEGGSLIAGIYNKIGFKAIGEDGFGRDIKGIVVDSKGEEAATLQSLHSGMGNFVLVPKAGETYTAKVQLNSGEKKYVLPAAKTQGIGFRADAVTHADELYIYVTSNTADDKHYTLIARSADKIYWGSAFKFNADNFFNTRIKKDMFQTGIVSLTILGPDGKPVSQRNVFINHHDGLKVTAAPGQDAYNVKDSATINLHVTDNTGNPVQTNLSVAVTDDGQIKDAIPADNIQSHMLLTSELKGHIENPAWYFAAANSDADVKLKEKALDNLLLTQGWRGFDWTTIDAPIPRPQFKAEPDISVSGNLINLFGKPAKNIKVSLLANGKQPIFIDTLTGTDGRFAFHHLPVTDTVAYLIKLHDKKDRSAAAEIKVDEFKPTEAAIKGLQRPMPWNMNTDSTLINYINGASVRSLMADTFTPPTSGKLLKQVDIKATRVIKYVGGEFGVELLKISEEELVKAKKMSLLELLYQKLPGLHISNFYSPSINSRPSGHITEQFVLGNMVINDIIADGQSVGNPFALMEDVTANPGGVNSAIDLKIGAPNMGSQPTTQEVFNRLKDFINILGADDVKSITLSRGTQYVLAIETRSGKGPFIGVSNGTYAFHPPVMQLPREFYSPKYPVKNALPDLRSTIHWEPNVVTDPSGNAKVTFYTADKPSTYTIIVEGTDMQGHFGVGVHKMSVTQVSGSIKR